MDSQTKARTLVFSQRNIFGKALFRCALHEFEDFICRFDSAELLAPQADPTNKYHAFAKRVAFHAPLALNPGLPKIRINGKYQLFLAVCGAPTDLLMLNAVADWSSACRTSACLIDELWVKSMPDFRYFLDILRRFDFVFLYYSQSVKPLSERTGRKCMFLPPGVDALKFCPFPERLTRVIDVYSIGRRSATTHQKLLKMAAEDGLFYLHDSMAGDQAIDSGEHRTLFVNLAKRSKYFLVNPGLIDRPETRGNQIEIGNRYFEGAASGTIMVGERPNNSEFERLFGWPDSLIDLPYGSDQIDQVLRELNREPERRERISRNNVAQALLKHDWTYRWEVILQTVGLEPIASLTQRKKDLNRMAEMVVSD